MKMQSGIVLVRACRVFMSVAALLLLATHLGAQGRNNPGRAQPAPPPRVGAPKDLTGYWVSAVSEDWRFRMTLPDKGDYLNVPLNPDGRKVADTWDPAKDQASGEQCRSYGAPVILRVPGRLHIYWQDDNTLRIDTDSGTQTRLLHFGGSAPQGEAPTWQGYSVASWEGNEISEYSSPNAASGNEGQKVWEPGLGYLKVVTTHLRPGYLRKNGVPYSGDASLAEYFDRVSEPDGGDTWLTVTMVVTDPRYLFSPFVYNAHFKKLPDNSGWNPTPCSVDQPR
jgi:hypothetical protein